MKREPRRIAFRAPISIGALIVAGVLVVRSAMPTMAAGENDATHGHATDDPICSEHALAENECGICHPELAAGLAPGEGIKVRLPSPRSAELAGVRLEQPQLVSTAGGVRGYAEVDYDRNRLAQITPLVDGVVQRVHADLGDTVQAGQPLVDIASAQVAEAKRSFLTARQDLTLRRQELERERHLRAQEIAAEREVQEAEAAFARAQTAAAAAEQNLRNLGLDEGAVRRIAETGDTTARLTIQAPFAGVVIERDAVLGEAVEHWEPLLRVADLSRMWLELSLPESALPALTPGLPVTARFSALPGREVTGELVSIAAGLDERTRMLRARAEVPNPAGLLKAGLYGEAEVALAGDGTALAVPLAAVRSLEQRPYVFVREADDLFVLRRVELGGRYGEHVAVMAGLVAGDAVVVEGSYALFTELLKSRLGAGCAGD